MFTPFRVLNGFDYCPFTLSLEIGKCKSFKFQISSFFFPQDLLATVVPLHFHINFRESMSVFSQKPSNNLIGIG